jgi:hypothetical protein
MCNGSCEACDIAPKLGTCTKVPMGQQPHGTIHAACNGSGVCKGSCDGTDSGCSYPTVTCASQTCSMGTLSLMSSCNGAGTCNGQTTASCNGFACNNTGGCYATCTADAQCGTGLYCHTDTQTCTATAPLGHVCSANVPCQSGTFCVNGYCCGTSSCGQCQTCGPSGSCAGSSATDGNTCSDGNMCTNGDKCQGGTCKGGTSTTCTAMDKCHVAGTCNSATGTCSNPVAQGATCTAGQACLAWYVDCDADGFGVSNGTPVYSCSQPPRPPAGMCVGPTLVPDYVSNNMDCCDQDPYAFPGATTGSYYATGCGNFDYNCDTHETPQYPIATCGGVTCAEYTSGPNAGTCYVSAGCGGCSLMNGACVSVSLPSGSTGGCGEPINLSSSTCYNTGPITCGVMTNPTSTMQPCL